MAPSLRSQVFFLSDTKVKSKNCVTLWPLLICTVLVDGEVKTLISQYNQNLLHHVPPKFLEKKASYTLAQVLKCWHLSVQFSCSVVSDSLPPPWTAARRPPCPSPTPRVYSYTATIHLQFWKCLFASSSPFPFVFPPYHSFI